MAPPLVAPAVFRVIFAVSASRVSASAAAAAASGLASSLDIYGMLNSFFYLEIQRDKDFPQGIMSRVRIKLFFF